MAAPTKSSRDELAAFLNDLDSLGGEANASAAAGASQPGPQAQAPAASSQPQQQQQTPQVTVQADASKASAGPEGSSSSSSNKNNHAKDAQDAMDFLDELSQRSSTPINIPAHTTQVPARKSLEGHRPSSRTSLRATSPQPPPNNNNNASAPSPSKATSGQAAAAAPAQSGWGWSSMWSSASTVLQQARETAEHNIASISHQGLPANIPTDSEQARKWTENMLGYVKQHTNVDVDKIRESGTKAFSDILNAVAPPIAEHTVVQVYLSHDMLGYEGVETLVYRALAKVMEQVEGGELHVNSGTGEQPSNSAQVNDDERNLNHASGLKEGYKLARANLESLIKARQSDNSTNSSHPETASASAAKKTDNDLPITVCPIYLRIQPVLAPFPFAVEGDAEEGGDDNNSSSKKGQQQLYFLMLLRDAEHNLERATMSQALPAAWLDIPFEENEWVENEMVDVIRKATETIGQDWIRTRQFGQAQAVQEAAKKLQADQEQQQQQQQQQQEQQQKSDSSA